MTDQITSSELRGFVADNTGRRKIDTEASLELHVRAATYVDALTQHIADLQQRLQEAQSSLAQAQSAPRAAPAEDPSNAAMMLLRNAQTAADDTLAEAASIRAQAATTLENAEEHARLEAEKHVAAAEDEARRIVTAAEQQAVDIANSNEKARDRAQFIQRQYVEKASSVRQEAEALVEFSRQVENLAETEMTLPVEAGAEVSAPAEEAAAPPPPPPADLVAEHARAAELAPAEAELAPAEAEPAPAEAEPATEAVAEVTEILEDPPAEPAPFDQETAAPKSQFLPPPPPPAPTGADVLDLTEDELEEALDSGDDIDDELFGDDELEGDVIDLRDNGDRVAQDFQFFGREA